MMETTTIDMGTVLLTVAIEAGPRLLGYALPDRPQLFASLPDAAITHPAVGEFRFLGGHRLWRAPEQPAVTYRPDDTGVVMTTRPDGVDLMGTPDGDGVVKEIAVRQRGAITIVDHTLRHNGTRPVRTAPWAITQFAPGGTAVLPQATGDADPDGLLPNRHVVLWPYSDPGDPEVDMGLELIRIHASQRPAKFKVAQPNRRGWLAYHRAGQLFVKWAAPHRDGLEYVDFDTSAQCYRDERFIELETLGPLTTLQPEEETRHRELWRLYDLGDEPPEPTLARLPEAPPELGAPPEPGPPLERGAPPEPGPPLERGAPSP